MLENQEKCWKIYWKILELIVEILMATLIWERLPGIIIKLHREKILSPLCLDDKKHGQIFVKKVLKEMIATIECFPH